MGKQFLDLEKTSTLGGFSKSITQIIALYILSQKCPNGIEVIPRKNIPWVMQKGKGFIS